ncbi:MAG: nucleotidyltransferase [Dinghuibacter sp.]|nr:nucleotidyltransferase [Dinghuibacter sp.]
MGKPVLLILAAGMASRYGSMKQTEGFGPSGETIMDYSIYDAIRSGYGKVVFIIRQDFAEAFEPVFNKKLAGRVEVDYVYQALNSHTGNVAIPPERTKPWGTAHAVLCAADAVNEPFSVINADDFYGRDAFQQSAAFLQQKCAPDQYAIVGYELAKTLSANGTVSRGVCTLDELGNLESVTERTKVWAKNGQIVYLENDQEEIIPAGTRASMNFWCFHPSVFDICRQQFATFLEQNINDPKSEFFIPLVGDHAIRENLATIGVLPTSAQWFGVTYKEDAEGVQQGIHQLVKDGVYPANLWE